MFEPITKYAAVHGRYYATEAELVTDLQRAGFQVGPQPKDGGRLRKTWLGSPGTHLDNGTPKPGLLVVRERVAAMVTDEPGQGEQFTWTTPVVPFDLARYLTKLQHDFFVEYRHHDDYKQGIPVLDAAYQNMDPAWWSSINYGRGGPDNPLAVGERWLPPLAVPVGFAWRWKPGSPGMRMEDVEVFPMEQYRRQFRPPVAVPKPAGEYQYNDLALANVAIVEIAAKGLTAEAGKAIRASAEKRK